MKSLSLFTFSLFLVLLGVRLFSAQSDKFDEIGFVDEEQEKVVSVFDLEPEKAKAILDGLDVYVKKSNVKRDIANKKIEPKKISPSEILEKKYTELNEAFLAQEDNMLDIKYMQDDISRLKKDANIEMSNSEIWSAEFILMLMMQEQFTLKEVNEMNGPDDLGLNMEDWVRMKETAQSPEFRLRINSFKGIYEELNNEQVANLEDIESREIDDEQIELFDDEKRNSAISDFMKRNIQSRNGENSELQDLEPEEFVSDSEDFDYENEPTRLPATLDEEYSEEYSEDEDEDEEDEEKTIQNYNDGYEDEY